MKRVLLLDDDTDLCEVLTEMILEMGASVCESVNTIEQLKAIEGINEKFDLIFIDMNLGPSSPPGIEAYKWLLQNGFGGKVAFFSGHGPSHPLIQKALEYPQVTVLEKPAKFSQIENLIQ